jgi:hypothetical protein
MQLDLLALGIAPQAISVPKHRTNDIDHERGEHKLFLVVGMLVRGVTISCSHRPSAFLGWATIWNGWLGELGLSGQFPVVFIFRRFPSLK